MDLAGAHADANRSEMITRDEAKLIRIYLNAGGSVYPSACRRGSFYVSQLNLEQVFTEQLKESEAPHG